MTAPDLDEVIELWHTTKKAAYPYLPLEQDRTLEQNSTFFRETLMPRCDVWVAEMAGGLPGFVALKGSYVDRLYVLPSAQRTGIGTALLRHAMALSPAGLELHTHQKNIAARTFYEKHGFVAVRFDISPPPESEPDVEYHWRPSTHVR
jgi:GNAT superfamily N-acetyltransferase